MSVSVSLCLFVCYVCLCTCVCVRTCVHVCVWLSTEKNRQIIILKFNRVNKLPVILEIRNLQTSCLLRYFNKASGVMQVS